MPSMHADANARAGSATAPAAEPALLVLLTAAQAPLLLLAVGIPRMDLAATAIGVLVALAAALGAGLARRLGQRWLHMVVYMLLFGNLGMLAGAWLDFGEAPLAGLTHWCHMHPGLAPDAIIAKLAGAPWSYGLMLVGCNAGMLIADRLWCAKDELLARCGRPWRSGVRCYAACNLGMLAGMLLAEGLMPGGHDHHHVDTAGVLGMVGLMAAGMTAGMLLGWWVGMPGTGRTAGAAPSQPASLQLRQQRRRRPGVGR